ncbi:hypothetical protein A3756_11580 [Oleiphilus sp. HI0086]|nr:hypothetical protein A3756_11580 [Oleiphilus sp. HI0086]
MGAARLVEFVIGLVKIKVSAIFLGIAGVGVFNQLNFLSQKLSTFTLLSTGEALVKQIAEQQTSSDELDTEGRDIVLSSLKAYISLVFVFMSLVVFVILLFMSDVTVYVFGSPEHTDAFLVGIVSLPLLVINSIPYGILRAFNGMIEIAKARIWSTLVNILHTVPLIYYYGLEGAIASVFICHLVALFFNYYYAQKLYLKKYRINFKAIIRASYNKELISELLQFSGFGLTIGLYVIASEFICRAIVVSNMGIEAIGLYSPVVMWSTLFTGFLVPALTTYLYTSLCQSKSNAEISSLLNDGLRLAGFAMMPLLLLAIPYRDLIIVIFYSSDFLEVEKYLPYHFLGVLFHVWFSVLSSSMSSTGRIKQHGFFRFFFLTLDILVTYVCVDYWGLYGWMLKHIVSPVIFFFIYIIYCRNKMDLRLSTSNLSIMIYAFISPVLLIALDNFVVYGSEVNYILGPVLVAGAFFLLNQREKSFVIEKVSKIKQSVVAKLC